MNAEVLRILQNVTTEEPYLWFGLAAHVDPQEPGSNRYVAAWQSSEAPTPPMLEQVIACAAQLAPQAQLFDVLGSDSINPNPGAEAQQTRAMIMTMASEGYAGAVQLAVIYAPVPELGD
jgi:hypothetical protein